MKKTKAKTHLLLAISAAVLLLVVSPIISVFADEATEAVSALDVSKSDSAGDSAKDSPKGNTIGDIIINVVSESDLNAVNEENVDTLSDSDDAGNNAVIIKDSEPKLNAGEQLNMDENFFLWVSYDLGYGVYSDNLSANIPFNGRDESVSTVVPEYADPNNTFLYWRDTQTGKIYHPGDTLTVKVSEMNFSRGERYNEETNTLEYFWSPDGWILKAIWESPDVTVSRKIVLHMFIPETNPNPYHIGYTGNDGINFYNWYANQEYDVLGSYNMKTEKFTLNAGYDKIKIPQAVPTIDGDTFIEWNTASDGTGKGFQPGDDFSIIQANSDGSNYVEFYPYLYAIFQKSTTKNVIRLYFHHFPISDDLTSLSLQYDENGIIPQVTFPAALENPLSEFKGWHNYSNDQTYEAGKTYYNINVKDIIWEEEDTDDRTDSLYAYFSGSWKQNIVRFELEGSLNLEFEGGIRSVTKLLTGTYNISEDKMTFDDGTIVIPADSAPDNEKGFEFIGWNTSEYGVGQNYLPGETFTFTDWLYVPLYATYKSNTDFTIVETDDEIINQITSAEPVVGITLVNDIDISKVKMVVANVEEELAKDVLAAMKEQTEIDENGDQPNYEMLDIKLVDSEDHGVKIESGKIKIVMAYPNIPNAKDYVYTIYHYNNGVLEEIPVEKFADGLVFYVDSFSPYALVWNEEKPDEEAISDPDDKTKPEQPAPIDNFIAWDKATGVKYTADQIIVRKDPVSGDDAKKYIAMTGEDPENALAYNIYITAPDGTVLTLLDGKTIPVEISKPNIAGTFTFKLYHIVGNSAISVNLKSNSGSSILFDADGFSPYVLAWHDVKSTGAPSTGDNFSPVIYIILVLLSLATIGSVVVYNRMRTVKEK